MVASLIAHRGTRLVSQLELAMLPPPQPRSTTHRCVPHLDVVAEILDELKRRNLAVTKETYSLSPDGNRFFGVLDTRDELMPDGLGVAIGIRNSHDQTLALGICAGTRVFVCDNLAFTGEVIRYRKHTSRISAVEVVRGAVDQVLDATHREARWLESLKARELNDGVAKSLLIDGLRRGACTAPQLHRIVRSYFVRQPDSSRTAWRLYNSFTDVYKLQPPNLTLVRSRRLNALFQRRVCRN